MYTTSFQLSTIHCRICASRIQRILYALRPKPTLVSPSIVTSWVMVHHDARLSPITIRYALACAGYDVQRAVVGSPPQDELEGEVENCEDVSKGYGGEISLREVSDQHRKRWNRPPGYQPVGKRYMGKKGRQTELCHLCYEDAQRPVLEDYPPSLGHVEIQMEKSQIATSSHEICANNTSNGSEPKGSNAPFIVDDNGGTTQLCRATLAIGGMTCASCVNAIKEGVEGKDWVKKVDVNLITNSGTIDFVGQDHASELVEMIEDIGFEAVLDSVALLQDTTQIKPPAGGPTSNQNPSEVPRRTVGLCVAGMHCQRCPERILRLISSSVPQQIHVENGFSIQNPILKITYTPHAPYFTIRHIISNLESMDPRLRLEIHHPPTLEDQSRALHDRRRREILIRVFGSVAIAIPTFAIGVLFMSLVPPSNGTRQFLEGPLWANVSRAQWALFIMATPVFLFCADLFHRKALKEVRATWRRGSKKPLLKRFYRFGSMDMLVSLGTSIAYLSSAAQLIAACVRPSALSNATSFYFDSVVFLTMFLLVGKLIEASSKAKTGNAVAMLGKLRPTTAILVNPESGLGNETEVDLLDYGDVVRVPYGASPPIDGKIVHGETAFDESSLTGESMLVTKAVGDQIHSGTVNKGSPISMEITAVSGTSMIDQIIEVVREGQTRHAPIEKIADTLTAYFVPLITLVAITTWLIWLGLGLSGVLPVGYLDNNSGGWAAWSLQFAIAVFVIACPCGLGLAAPTALFVGGGLAAKHGILVKGGGEAFEKASRLNCIVFDKTGTLTMGEDPVATDYQLLPLGRRAPSVNEIKLLIMVKQLEENSGHPIAKAIVSYCNIQTVGNCRMQEFTETAGKGMKGRFRFEGDGGQIDIIVGNETLMHDFGVNIPTEASTTMSTWKQQGKSIAVVATKSSSPTGSWHAAAMFGISDQIRPEAASTIKSLRKRGISVWMLSGDNYVSASAVGAQVGIPSENIIAGVLPTEKAAKIQYLQQSLKVNNKNGEVLGKRALIAMVGDGINDSPALTAADVGIAIGSGSDIAISSAEFILVSSNLNALITLMDLSKIVFNRIKFNFGWALIYNLIGVPVAGGVLYPLVINGDHVRLDPVWASLAMALSSISVVCSSLALKSRIPGIGFSSPKR
jgi:P-type Cu+ transporter